MQEKDKGSSIHFWDREDIQKATQYVDGWSTMFWHQHHGGVGIPTEIVDERASTFRRSSPSSMPGIFDAYTTVEHALKNLNNPRLLRGLLLWLYPKVGTYERSNQIQDFRTTGIKQAALDFGWSDKCLDQCLVATEKNFLRYLAVKIK